MAARLLLVPANTAAVLTAAQGPDEHPRIDVLDLARALDADLLSYDDVERAAGRGTRLVRRLLGRNAALAWMALRRRPSTVLSLDDGVGLAVALLLRCVPFRRTRHVVLGNRLSERRRAPFRLLGLRKGIDAIVAYTTLQTRWAEEKLGFDKTRLFPVHAQVDTGFFRPPQPLDVPMPERTGIVSVGRARRDDETLFAALDALPVVTTVVPGGRWSRDDVRFDEDDVPAGIKLASDLTPYDLRLLYQSASLAVVALEDSDAPAGLSAIYEALACGTPVVATATRGLADSLRSLPGVVTVPAGRVEELQRAVSELLMDDHRKAALGAEGRQCVEQTRSLDLWIQRLSAVVRKVEGGRVASRVDDGMPATRSHALDALLTRFRLRGVQQVGRGVRACGAPRVLNRGHVTLGDGTTLASGLLPCELVAHASGRIEVGRNVVVEAGASIVARGLVRVGDGCRIGAQAIITHDGSHRRALEGATGEHRPIVLGEGCTLGVRVTVLEGVTIGEGAVIVAGSVVSQDVPPFSLAGGVPAHVLRRLDRGVRPTREEQAPAAPAARPAAPAKPASVVRATPVVPEGVDVS